MSMKTKRRPVRNAGRSSVSPPEKLPRAMDGVLLLTKPLAFRFGDAESKVTVFPLVKQGMVHWVTNDRAGEIYPLVGGRTVIKISGSQVDVCIHQSDSDTRIVLNQPTAYLRVAPKVDIASERRTYQKRTKPIQKPRVSYREWGLPPTDPDVPQVTSF